MELSTASVLLAVIVIMVLVNVMLQRELNRQADFQDREELRGQVKQFRLYKMLDFLGVDRERYIERVPKDDISEHVKNCEACSNNTVCDSHLRDGKPVTNMSFCPNYKSLIRHSCTTLSENT